MDCPPAPLLWNPPASHVPDLAPLTEIGNYRVTTYLGSTGVAKAWVAEHRLFSRTVVMVLPRWREDTVRSAIAAHEGANVILGFAPVGP